MSETSEHAARLLSAYQAQEKRFVERRFPLSFAPEVPVLRELYSQAKGLRWNDVVIDALRGVEQSIRRKGKRAQGHLKIVEGRFVASRLFRRDHAIEFHVQMLSRLRK